MTIYKGHRYINKMTEKIQKKHSEGNTLYQLMSAVITL
jgi:hypothetical protein